MASDLYMPALNHGSCNNATMVFSGAHTLSTMVDYWDRLEAALKHAGKSLKDLQLHLKVSYQAMKKVQDGKTKALTAENNAHAARFLSIDSYWLATGEGKMISDAQTHCVAPHVRHSNAVHDNSKQYLQTPCSEALEWPFITISPAEYSSLTDLQKGLIEGYTKRLVEEATHNKSPNKQKSA